MSKWTIDTVTAEASQYQTRSEFNRAKRSAYDAAKEFGLLDNLFPEQVEESIWTVETVTAEAAKYKTRSEFAKGKRLAYEAAKELDILDKLFLVVPTTPAEVVKIIDDKIKQIMANPDDPRASQYTFVFWAKCNNLPVEFAGRRDEYNQLAEQVKTLFGLPWSIIASRFDLSPTLLPYWQSAEELAAVKTDSPVQHVETYDERTDREIREAHNLKGVK